MCRETDIEHVLIIQKGQGNVGLLQFALPREVEWDLNAFTSPVLADSPLYSLWGRCDYPGGDFLTYTPPQVWISAQGHQPPSVLWHRPQWTKYLPLPFGSFLSGQREQLFTKGRGKSLA